MESVRNTESATRYADKTELHEHGWTTQSSHTTSDGVVVYVRCESCGTQRVDLLRRGGLLPAAMSRELSPDNR